VKGGSMSVNVAPSVVAPGVTWKMYCEESPAPVVNFKIGLVKMPSIFLSVSVTDMGAPELIVI
jgi:hypothetical protein